MRWILCFTLTLLTGIAYGGESNQTLTGRLLRVEGNVVILKFDREASFATGARIKFYENIPGVGDVDVKGNWVVFRGAGDRGPGGVSRWLNPARARDFCTRPGRFRRWGRQHY